MRLINADEVVKKLNLAISMMSGMMKMLNAEDDEGLQMELKAYREIRDGIKEEPTIEPERKTGTDNECTFLTCKHFRDEACSKCRWAYSDMFEPDEEGSRHEGEQE